MVRQRAVVVAALVAGCAASVPVAVAGAGPGAGGPPPRLEVEAPDRCDPLDRRSCLLPFPSDHFTVADPTTDTGRRVALDIGSMPRNVHGTPIDPTDINRNDGFSPGNALLTFVPGLSIEATGLATTRHLGASLAPDAPAVIVDTATGERWPYFAELDAQAVDPHDRLLVLRPARNFAEGHRYVVGLRRLRDASGSVLDAGPVFRAYRDRVPTRNGALERRRGEMETVFHALHRAGVERGDLYLAWGFTVASGRNLSERMLHIRDDAFAALDGGAPAFEVTSIVDDVDDHVARRITGTFDVPNYLTGSGGPGSSFNWDGDLPARNGTRAANFVCVVPRSAFVAPARAVAYGHGLLGGAREVNSFGAFADVHGFVMCATDWIGMASEDVPNVLSILQDNSRFATLADRAQQGILDMLFLARLLRDDGGFVTDAAFRAPGGAAVLRTGEVFFNGNSQGGIMGGAATAVSTEWTRAVLGVPGMNYSTLLTRSVDYDVFSTVASAAYPDPLLRTVQLSLIQLLWDRAEANGYAQHMTDDPYPGTPAHDVLLFEAFGDHQVANIATNVQARTIGARVRQPALGPGRTLDVDPFFGLDAWSPGPSSSGSVLVVWDFGTPAPPPDNVAPRPPEYGSDPHGAGGREPRVAAMVSDFLRTDGTFVDPCAPGVPCTTP